MDVYECCLLHTSSCAKLNLLKETGKSVSNNYSIALMNYILLIKTYDIK